MYVSMYVKYVCIHTHRETERDRDLPTHTLCKQASKRSLYIYMCV